MRTILESSTAVAVAARMACPARQDCPKNAPGFFALLRDHRQFHLACLDIEHRLCGIPLREDRVLLGGEQSGFPLADFAEY